jgi:hypothetical protein
MDASLGPMVDVFKPMDESVKLLHRKVYTLLYQPITSMPPVVAVWKHSATKLEGQPTL